MQLAAELADEIDAERMRLGRADVDRLAGQPGEGFVGEIGVGELLQQLARASGPASTRTPQPVVTG